MNIEILRIHEDYVTATTIFNVNVTEWLASPGGTKSSKPIEEMSFQLLVLYESFVAGGKSGYQLLRVRCQVDWS